MALDGSAALWRLVATGASPIVPLNETREGIPFYCVHAIGGAAPPRELARWVGDDGPILGIRAPKELIGNAITSSIEDLSRYYLDALTSFQPTGAMMLGGHSVGGIIALEMAQQLRASGREVLLLVAFDTILHNWNGMVAGFPPSFFLKWLRNLPNWCRDSLMIECSKHARWVRQELQTKRIVSKTVNGLRNAFTVLANPRQARRYRHPIDFLFDPNASETYLSFPRAVCDAAEAYVPKPYAGRAVVYLARARPLLPRQSNIETLSQLFQVEAAWRSICADIEAVRVRGTHRTVLDEPWIALLGVDLRKRLNEIRREYGSGAAGNMSDVGSSNGGTGAMADRRDAGLQHRGGRRTELMATAASPARRHHIQISARSLNVD
jgi:thioesterase domain-containing protein